MHMHARAHVRMLVQAWRDAGLLYVCTPELYDDWYWMFATVAETQSEEPDAISWPQPLGTAGVTRVVCK